MRIVEEGRSPTLEFADLLESEANELVEAHRRAALLVHARDISAAGDEVEVRVRQLLTRKLPKSYYVGHGHIVDRDWSTSPQIDVLIADAHSNPVLFSGERGDYVPFEAVFAVGEVKSTFESRSSPVEAFSNKLRIIRDRLHRETTPPGLVAPGLRLGAGFNLGETRPYRNPLFSFMLFADSGDFDHAKVAAFLVKAEPPYLPSLVCVLGRGVMFRGEVSDGEVNVDVMFEDWERDPPVDWRWVYLPLGEPDKKLAGTFGFLYFALLRHLNTAMLSSPDHLAYLISVFTYGTGTAYGDPRIK